MGSQGPQGATGPQGTQGLAGPQGATGNNVVGVAGSTAYLAVSATTTPITANSLTSLGSIAALTGSYYFRAQVSITAAGQLNAQCLLSTSPTSVVWAGSQLGDQFSLANNVTGTVSVTAFYFGMSGQTVYLLIKTTAAANALGSTGPGGANQTGIVAIRLL